MRILVASPHGEELTLTMLVAGDTLDELPILDRQPCSASAEYLEPTQLVTLSAADVLTALISGLELLMAVAAGLAGTVRRLTGGAADMVFLDLPRRLPERVAAETVVVRGGAAPADLGMSQAGSAALLGVSRESLHRALSQLTRRGWVTVDGAAHLGHDESALCRFARS